MDKPLWHHSLFCGQQFWSLRFGIITLHFGFYGARRNIFGRDCIGSDCLIDYFKTACTQRVNSPSPISCLHQLSEGFSPLWGGLFVHTEIQIHWVQRKHTVEWYGPHEKHALCSLFLHPLVEISHKSPKNAMEHMCKPVVFEEDFPYTKWEVYQSSC